MLGMRVNDCAGIAMPVCQHEERGALTLAQALDLWWQLQILAIYVLHKEVFRLHTLLLYPRWRDIDFVTVSKVIQVHFYGVNILDALACI